eukprot:gene22700-29856_t
MASVVKQGVGIRFGGRENVPPIGLGLAALGRPGYINLGHEKDMPSDKSVDAMRSQAALVMDAAWKSGIRYYDVARSYGKAEEFLSSWLKTQEHIHAEVMVGSKWGYRYTADWRVDTGGEPHEVKEHTKPNLVKQTGETDEYLGGQLNLYQIHSATLDSGVLDSAEVLGELARIKSTKGWRIGLSLSGVQQAETLRKAMQVEIPGGGRLFDCVQATWNLMEQSCGEALLEAREAGMDVIVKEAMTNGRILQRNDLQLMAKELGVPPDALALAAVILQPFQPMVLSGAATVPHVQSNAAALELASSLDEEVVAKLMSALLQNPQEYWSERSALSWN